MFSQTSYAIKSTGKFAKISGPDSRDPDYNREGSNQCSPCYPHDAEADGALTTL